MKYIDFDNIKASTDWAFDNVRSTEQWTHGYHRYPAKFLPNVVKKLIEKYATTEGGVIADLFAGCGTTLVEAKVHGIHSIGTDVNPVATLITKSKITPIEPASLSSECNKLISSFSLFEEKEFINIAQHNRLDYWFLPSEKSKIAFLYQTILENIADEQIQNFLLVCLSHILKNCSRWLQSSTKPQVDPNKDISDPFISFKLHCKQMQQKNELFYNELSVNGYMNVRCDIREEDARSTSIESNSVDIVITSPPYVTSYEYADIHQLTGYWFEYFSDIKKFRKLFIGTSYSDNKDTDVSSLLGLKIVKELQKKDKRAACDVANYFNDMQKVAIEMHRIIKKDGYACIVIGNTTIKDVHIKSAEVFFDMLKMAGFRKREIIKRNIPYKLMPTLRDKVTGKFTTINNRNCKQVYPNEYIVIVKK